HPPVGQAIRLGGDQVVQLAEAGGIAGVAVECLHVFLNKPGHVWAALAQPRQLGLVNLFVAVAFRQPCLGLFGARRQVAKEIGRLRYFSTSAWPSTSPACSRST